jgi:hypothetical protein
MYALLFALGGAGGLTAAVTTAVTFLREHFNKQQKSAPSNIVTITDSEGNTIEINMTKHVDASEIASKLVTDYGSKSSDAGPTPLPT